MGSVVRFPRHARASSTGSGKSWKSSAETSPPENSFNLPIVGQSGRQTRRLIREIVARVTPVADATSSSESPRADINSERCAMPDLYVKRTSPVKANCTSHVLYGDKLPVHNTYMAERAVKKVVSRLKGPKFRPTFIKQWREHRGLTQQQLAERVTEYLQEHGFRKKPYSHASIGRIENGKMAYTQPVLEALAHGLQIDAASLLMRNPVDSQGLWSIWDQALPGERQIITEQAESLVRNRRRAG